MLKIVIESNIPSIIGKVDFKKVLNPSMAGSSASYIFTISEEILQTVSSYKLEEELGEKIKKNFLDFIK